MKTHYFFCFPLIEFDIYLNHTQLNTPRYIFFCWAMMKNKLGLIILVLLLGSISGKQISRTFAFTSLKQTKGWMFLDKITLSEGITDIKVTTQKTIGNAFSGKQEVFIQFIPEERWAQDQARKCNDITRNPLLSHSLPLDGTLSISQTTLKVERQQIYYFVLNDCQNNFLSDYTNPNMQISITVSVINNGSYLGQEEDHWFIIPVILATGLWIIFSNKDFMKSATEEEKDYAKIGLFAGVSTNISSLIWKSFGFLIYTWFGMDYLFFHLIYLFMHAVSETIVLALLLLIGTGWSLTYIKFPNIDLMLPAFGFVGMMNIMMTLLTQLNSQSHDRHHVFDTVSGTLLILERLTIAFVFLVASGMTYSGARYRVKQYLKVFVPLAALYICGMPIIVLLANTTMDAKNRNEFVFILVQTLKTVCNILLTYMVSSSQSQYKKLSYQNTSFMPDTRM